MLFCPVRLTFHSHLSSTWEALHSDNTGIDLSTASSHSRDSWSLFSQWRIMELTGTEEIQMLKTCWGGEDRFQDSFCMFGGSCLSCTCWVGAPCKYCNICNITRLGHPLLLLGVGTAKAAGCGRIIADIFAHIPWVEKQIVWAVASREWKVLNLDTAVEP